MLRKVQVEEATVHLRFNNFHMLYTFTSGRKKMKVICNYYAVMNA